MLIFYRKPRLEDENKRYPVVASNTRLCGFDTRMDSALPLMYDTDDLAQLANAKTKWNRACINPFAFGKPEFQTGIAMLFYPIRQNVQRQCELLRKHWTPSKTEATVFWKNLWNSARNMLYMSGITDAEAELCETMQSALTFPFLYHISPENEQYFSRETLWEQGISGDYPIVVIDLQNCAYPFDQNITNELERSLRAFKYLTMKAERFDLVILYCEGNGIPARFAICWITQSNESESRILFGKTEGFFRSIVVLLKRYCLLIAHVIGPLIPFNAEFTLSVYFSCVEKALSAEHTFTEAMRRSLWSVVPTSEKKELCGWKRYHARKRQTEGAILLYPVKFCFRYVAKSNFLGFSWTENSREKETKPFGTMMSCAIMTEKDWFWEFFSKTGETLFVTMICVPCPQRFYTVSRGPIILGKSQASNIRFRYVDSHFRNKNRIGMFSRLSWQWRSYCRIILRYATDYGSGRN